MSPSEMLIAKRVKGLVVAIAAVTCAFVLAAPAAAEPSLTASNRTVRPGQVINVGGSGWETFWAVVCPAPDLFLDVTFRQGGSGQGLAYLTSLEIWPFTGSWNHDVRIPATARPGPAQIFAAQEQASFDLFRGGCYRARTVLRSVDVNVVGTPVVDPPAPPADLRLDSIIPAGGGNRARPGATLEVSGTGFGLPDRCFQGTGVRFSLTDASGSAALLGERFHVDEGGRVTDDHNRRRIYLPLPDDGLTPGLAAVIATRAGGGNGCTRTAGLNIRIVMGLPAVRVSPGSRGAGDVTRITGTNWRTDRCDRVVGLFLVDGADRFKLASASPKGLGAFSVETKLPADADPGSARIVAEQIAGLEVRTKTTPPGKTRCYFGKLAKRAASVAVTIASPPPPPPPPPPALPQCSNGKDDDGDGKVDLGDPGCENAKDDSESPDPKLPQCSDGKDNDGDGKVDLADPGCENAKDDSESLDPKLPECSNGKDDDGDGAADYPSDKQCSSKEDDDESK